MDPTKNDVVDLAHGAGTSEPRGGRLVWQLATVSAVRRETPTVKTFTLALPAWQPHRAGQHYDLRLRAPDGYQAQRSYSVASEPERMQQIDLTVERIEDGEVSSYLHDVVVPGDRVEVRGPFGGYFVWDAAVQTEPVLLVAGGSGVVPLMSMLRHRRAVGAHVPAFLLYSARTAEDVIYADELEGLASGDHRLRVAITLTRARPPGFRGYARRVDEAMLRDALSALPAHPRCYVCGSTGFVEAVATLLSGLGLPAKDILTERFGPTGQP
jgi:ferredoxin-NADP reductase